MIDASTDFAVNNDETELDGDLDDDSVSVPDDDTAADQRDAVVSGKNEETELDGDLDTDTGQGPRHGQEPAQRRGRHQERRRWAGRHRDRIDGYAAGATPTRVTTIRKTPATPRRRRNSRAPLLTLRKIL